jgi:hypothetical protein
MSVLVQSVRCCSSPTIRACIASIRVIILWDRREVNTGEHQEGTEKFVLVAGLGVGRTRRIRQSELGKESVQPRLGLRCSSELNG